MECSNCMVCDQSFCTFSDVAVACQMRKHLCPSVIVGGMKCLEKIKFDVLSSMNVHGMVNSILQSLLSQVKGPSCIPMVGASTLCSYMHSTCKSARDTAMGMLDNIMARPELHSIFTTVCSGKKFCLYTLSCLDEDMNCTSDLYRVPHANATDSHGMHWSGKPCDKGEKYCMFNMSCIPEDINCTMSQFMDSLITMPSGLSGSFSWLMQFCRHNQAICGSLAALENMVKNIPILCGSGEEYCLYSGKCQKNGSECVLADSIPEYIREWDGEY